MTFGLEAKQRIRGTFLKAAPDRLLGQLPVHLLVLASSPILRTNALDLDELYRKLIEGGIHRTQL